MKETLFKQSWWVSLAVLLAVLQVVWAIGMGTDSEAGGTWRIVAFTAWGAGAVLVILGARFRLDHRQKGDVLIALAVVPSVATGIIAFWLPPMWLITVAAVVVIAYSIRDAITPVGIATSSV